MLLNGSRFTDPVTEDPRRGSTEIWEFVNLTLDAHPIHLHAVYFQLVDRQAFDVQRRQRTSEVVSIGKILPAPPEEQGRKDTVVCPPGQISKIVVPSTGDPGNVWHCHMLEQEDMK
jgi:spore coat protein A